MTSVCLKGEWSLTWLVMPIRPARTWLRRGAEEDPGRGLQFRYCQAAGTACGEMLCKAFGVAGIQGAQHPSRGVQSADGAIVIRGHGSPHRPLRPPPRPRALTDRGH